ncbi:MAG TPA: HAD family hydrolase [Kofleriaceae bacterium]|jgi:putative hydrolase of the HAD superfamily|nr:HAD family hydrolase [Kofleriaceae bacterium]
MDNVGSQAQLVEPPVVTFDAGQTLIDLDLEFLARRLAERGVTIGPPTLAAAAPAAWQRYDQLVDRTGADPHPAGKAGGIPTPRDVASLIGPAGGHPWRGLMATLLEGAGVTATQVGPLVDWLWDEQPRVNLWRAQVPGMVPLARELVARGVRVAVLSNSEGRLAELLAEIGIADVFAAVIDSGRLAIEKPDRRIFDHALAVLGAHRPGIHIGDSWPADIAGALGAGWRAIWFGRRATPVDDPRVAIARDAAEVRAVLAGWLDR